MYADSIFVSLEPNVSTQGIKFGVGKSQSSIYIRVVLTAL